MHDAGDTGALVDIGLVPPERCILGVGPVVPHAVEGEGTAAEHIKIVPHAERTPLAFGPGQNIVGRIPGVAAQVFRTGSVVIGENDQGVLQPADTLPRSNTWTVR